MGGFTFDIGIGIPSDLIGWAMQLLPAALAIALERSTVRRSRGDYLMSLILYPVGCALMVILASIFAMAAGYEDQQNVSIFLGYRDLIILTPISLAALGIEAFYRILVSRLIVRRLRDGGITVLALQQRLRGIDIDIAARILLQILGDVGFKSKDSLDLATSELRKAIDGRQALRFLRRWIFRLFWWKWGI